MKYVLTDIEGTTTDIAFVHQVLFPYAYTKLTDFVRNNISNDEVKQCIKQVQTTLLSEKQIAADLETVIAELLNWIEADRKHPALKYLQGLIWEEGYKKGNFKGHIYSDVVPQIQLWRSRGIGVGIYSSGSVGAQKLLFGYSDYGDVNHLFDHYFDTQIGHKREVAAYQNIAAHLQLSPEQILFLSDVAQELDAAKAVGYHTIQLLREGTVPSQTHSGTINFQQIEVMP
ncbi:MAG: acireductone synthase [Saprospiraceae bacterium]|nr:acireductone synthase [Saprospiraceae bacterium]